MKTTFTQKASDLVIGDTKIPGYVCCLGSTKDNIFLPADSNNQINRQIESTLQEDDIGKFYKELLMIQKAYERDFAKKVKTFCLIE